MCCIDDLYHLLCSDIPHLPPELPAAEVNMDQAEKEDTISGVSKICMLSYLHTTGNSMAGNFGEVFNLAIW